MPPDLGFWDIKRVNKQSLAVPVRFHEWGSVPLFSQKKLKTPVTRKGQVLLRVNKE
jgi:hypothetical protein